MHENNLSGYSPHGLIMARSEAFSRGDFGFIFDTYHSDSNFRRQFSDRAEYLELGAVSLGKDYQITRCQVLEQREHDGEAEVIFLMEMKVHGAVQCFAELAWLRREHDAWLYHRGQKITHEDLPADPQSLRFADFARLDPATIF